MLFGIPQRSCVIMALPWGMRKVECGKIFKVRCKNHVRLCKLSAKPIWSRLSTFSASKTHYRRDESGFVDINDDRNSPVIQYRQSIATDLRRNFRYMLMLMRWQRVRPPLCLWGRGERMLILSCRCSSYARHPKGRKQEAPG
jgi:hypothetical protein